MEKLGCSISLNKRFTRMSARHLLQNFSPVARMCATIKFHWEILRSSAHLRKSIARRAPRHLVPSKSQQFHTHLRHHYFRHGVCASSAWFSAGDAAQWVVPAAAAATQVAWTRVSAAFIDWPAGTRQLCICTCLAALWTKFLYLSH